METVAITLERPISQFVDRQSRDHNVSPQQTVAELVSLGFETLLQKLYNRYRRGQISFGRFAQELGATTWELNHLLEDQDWSVHNLPS